MRDLLISAIVFGALPFILMRPHIGILVWSWLSYMNPHRLAFGFAYHYPFAQLVAGATIIGFLISREPKRIPWYPITIVWLIFLLWMNFTTLFAFAPERAIPEWDRTMKIQLVAWLTLFLMNTPNRLYMLAWVIVVSLGFFGIKGGLFSILTGGQYLVLGPPESFISENNTLALALLMTLPLFRYLQIETKSRYVRWGLWGAMGLVALSILTSFSRGAFLGISAMLGFMVLNSRHKLKVFILLVIAVPLFLSFMPEKWFERMETIKTYDQDASAMSRINVWQFAWNLALDNPIVGGGFKTFTPELFQKYAPDPSVVFDPHSIYFQVLGEHGFVGLFLFLAMGWLALRTGKWVVKNTKDREDLRWANTLASMLRLSLIGYAVGGAFLGLAYYDLYYHIVGMLILTRKLVSDALAADEAKEHSESSSTTAGSEPAGAEGTLSRSGP